MYIERSIESVIEKTVKTFKVVLLTGARQVGKSTTLNHLYSNGEYQYISLDDFKELDIAKRDPRAFFLNHPGKMIIDEIQYAPELFREIKFRVDQNDEYGQYILTGSQTFSLMQGVTESLAGRVGIIHLDSLSLREILQDPFSKPMIPDNDYIHADRKSLYGLALWEKIHRGSMPELIKSPDLDIDQYYAAYLSTYIERDVRIIKNVQDLGLFFDFIRVLAARVAQLVNYSEMAKELGVNERTVKSWMTVLQTSGLIKLIQPFSNNHLSRIIKTPKVYFMDTGLVAYLLLWRTPETMMAGAMSGALLENFAVSEIIKSFHNTGKIHLPIFFYRDKDQKEMDLIIEDSGVLYPIEIKQTSSPHPNMAKHFKLLEKAQGYEIGNRLILCQVEKRYYLTEDLIAYPVGAI